jgi:tetratricopeptide (TPR) repeat protein
MMLTAMRSALILACLFCTPAWAARDCFAELTGGDEPYTEALDHDPRDTIPVLLKAQRAAAADPGANPSAAHIDAMLMEAYFAVGDLPQALEAATLGLSSLVPADGVGLQRRLQFRRLVLLNANGQLHQAAEAAEADAAAVPDDAPELTCVLIERGYLRLRIDRVAAAASDLIRAASLAREQHLQPYQFEANGILSMLYARDGFRAEAMALADAAVAYYEHGPDKVHLADAYFRRGDANLEGGNYAAAEPDFWKAISLSREVGGVIDVSAAEQRMCKVLARLPDHRDAPDARQFCTGAYERAPLRDSESARLILASLAEIELADQRPVAAVGYLDRALAPGGAELSARTQTEIRRLRGRARQMLGDTAGALQDMTDVLAWLDQERVSSTTERVSLLHVKTELEQKDVELARARRRGHRPARGVASGAAAQPDRDRRDRRHRRDHRHRLAVTPPRRSRCRAAGGGGAPRRDRQADRRDRA